MRMGSILAPDPFLQFSPACTTPAVRFSLPNDLDRSQPMAGLSSVGNKV